MKFAFMLTEWLGGEHKIAPVIQELYKFATVGCLVALILTVLVL